MLTVCVWHEEGTEQERELDGGRQRASADTGNGNRCKSEPGDMTYEQTVGTLMGPNSRASDMARSGCR